MSEVTEELLLPYMARKGTVTNMWNNYILYILNEDNPLQERLSRAKVLPMLMRSLLLRMPLPPRLDKKIEQEIEYYNKIIDDISLPRFTSISRDPERILDWYNEAVLKKKTDDTKTWMLRVAIASAIILSDMLIEMRVVSVPLSIEDILKGETK